MSETALFIPLKAEYFIAFREGRKIAEFRPYGPRWNERTCRVGRPVVLSRGYGKRERLTGTITAFERSTRIADTPAWKDCYGDRAGEAACIYIRIDR